MCQIYSGLDVTCDSDKKPVVSIEQGRDKKRSPNTGCSR